MLGSLCEISGETCTRGDASRSQSLRSTVRLKSRTRRNGWETGVNAGVHTLEPKLCRGSWKSAE